MFAQIPILIIFVSILKLSYVGPHRLAWWKVRIGDGPRIPDTRRIPRDTFPPSHAVVHPIQSLTSKQGCIFFQIPREYLGIHSHQAPPLYKAKQGCIYLGIYFHLITPCNAWFPCRVYIFPNTNGNTSGYIFGKPHRCMPLTLKLTMPYFQITILLH